MCFLDKLVIINFFLHAIKKTLFRNQLLVMRSQTDKNLKYFFKHFGNIIIIKLLTFGNRSFEKRRHNYFDSGVLCQKARTAETVKRDEQIVS